MVSISFSSYFSISIALPPAFSIAFFAEYENASTLISNLADNLPLPKILTKSFFEQDHYL